MLCNLGRRVVLVRLRVELLDLPVLKLPLGV